jgi:hypothetical protein
MITQPTFKTLNESLNGWPPSTKGHSIEMDLINKLSDLCKEHGYGRVHQLAGQIWDIWNHPEKAETYKKYTEARNKMLIEARNSND